MQVISSPRHSRSLQWPSSWTTPKAFSSQMVVISLHPVRAHVHNRNISLSSGVRLMMLWRHSSYRIAFSPSSVGALEQASVVPTPTSPKSQRSSAGSQQPIPENSYLQALISPADIVEMQVGHSALWLPHVLEHGHHTHLCTLMGKEKTGRCHPLNLLPTDRLHLCRERISPVLCKSQILSCGPLPAVVQQWGTHLFLNFKAHFYVEVFSQDLKQ